MIAFFDRFIAVPGLLITSSVCYTLLILHLTAYRGSESLAAWARTNRLFVTVIVQLLSQLLGLIHVHVVCALLRSSLLLWISTKAFPLYFVHFIQNLSSPRITWVLPWKVTVVLAAFTLVSIAPAPLWAAAIAPLPAERQIVDHFEIPTFNVSDISRLWEGDSKYAPGNYWLSDQGLFSFGLISSLRASLLSSAREASVTSDGIHKHAKLDKTGYIYKNRSYGTGAVAGFETIQNARTPLEYQYAEKTMKASVSCFRNESIDYTFHKDRDVNYLIWEGRGTLADGSSKWGTLVTSFHAAELFSWTSAWNNKTKRAQLQFFTGISDLGSKATDTLLFAQFNNVQCDVGLDSKEFQVKVNITSKVIATVPSGKNNLPWPKYGDEIAVKVQYLFRNLALEDNCNYGCEIGTALRTNIDRLFGLSDVQYSVAWFQAIEDYIASLVDDWLIILKTTRLVANTPEPTERVEVLVTVPSLIFGNMFFVIGICVLNSAIALLYIVEAIRTRFWHLTPPLDIMDDSEVIMAAFEGGRQYAMKEQEGSPASRSMEQMSRDTMLTLRLEGVGSKKPVLIPEDFDESVELVTVKQPLLVKAASFGFEDVMASDSREV